MRGVNLGAWLNPEGYILGGRNISFYRFEERFIDIYGPDELAFLHAAFIDTYITEDDFRRIAGWGADAVRLPIHYKLVEERPYEYSERGLAVISKALDWAYRHGLKVILDLHAAAGAQNGDWHSDSTGTAFLWEDEEFRKRTCALWKHLARTFAAEPGLAGYDILNEPVIAGPVQSVVRELYRGCIDAIRASDPDRIIYLEGLDWAQDIDLLQDMMAPGIGVSIHTYQPIDFVFNFRRGYRYPGLIREQRWDKRRIREHLRPYKEFADRHGLTIQVGEFGINYRGNAYGEVDYLRDLLSVFNEYGFDWTYWTYKCVAQGCHPDGILQYEHNPPWIRREGPVFGIENLYTEWKSHKHDIIDSWRSERFTENRDIVAVLKKALPGKKR